MGITGGKMNRSEDVSKLVAQLVKAQAEFKSAKKDIQGYGYKYADLDGVYDAVKSALYNHGIVLVSSVKSFDPIGGWLTLESILMHENQFLSSECVTRVLPQQNRREIDSQAIGSAITYARRYCLGLITSIVAELDDDASSIISENKKIKAPNAPTLFSAEDRLRYENAVKSSGLTSEGAKSYVNQLFGVKAASLLDRKQFDELCDALENMLNRGGIER